MGVVREKMEILFHILIFPCLAFKITGKYHSSLILCFIRIVTVIPQVFLGVLPIFLRLISECRFMQEE